MNDRYGLALMMIREGCGDPRGLATKILDGASIGLSHDDLCRLSRAFNRIANLGMPQDDRINEWLKQQIALSPSRAQPHPSTGAQEGRI